MRRLARGRLQVRCDTCGRFYRTGRAYAKPPYPCVRECSGTVRWETLAEQAQRHDAWAQFRADARETMAVARIGEATMPSTLTNRPWRQGGAIVRVKP